MILNAAVRGAAAPAVILVEGIQVVLEEMRLAALVELILVPMGIEVLEIVANPHAMDALMAVLIVAYGNNVLFLIVLFLNLVILLLIAVLPQNVNNCNKLCYEKSSLIYCKSGSFGFYTLPWQCLNFLPLPQGHGSLRETLPQVSGRFGSKGSLL